MKIKWLLLPWTPKDMWFPLNPKLNPKSEFSLKLVKPWICGSKYKWLGLHWKLSLLGVISLDKCPLKLRNFRVLIKIGSKSWKKLWKLRKSFLAVKMICWKISYPNSKRIWMFAKNLWNNIWKRRERNSLDSISYPILLYLKFCLKVLNLNLSKKISKNCSMLSIKSLSTRTLKRKVLMKRSSKPLPKSWVKMKKPFLCSITKNVKELLKDGWDLYKTKCKKPLRKLLDKPVPNVLISVLPKWKISLNLILPKSLWSECKPSGPKRSLKVWKEPPKMKRELWNPREEKFNKWWNSSLVCV